MWIGAVVKTLSLLFCPVSGELSAPLWDCLVRTEEIVKSVSRLEHRLPECAACLSYTRGPRSFTQNTFDKMSLLCSKIVHLKAMYFLEKWPNYNVFLNLLCFLSLTFLSLPFLSPPCILPLHSWLQPQFTSGAVSHAGKRYTNAMHTVLDLKALTCSKLDFPYTSLAIRKQDSYKVWD